MRLLPLSILMAFAALTAHAQSITGNVIGPRVGKAGDLSVGYRTGYEFDNDNAAQDGRFSDRLDMFYTMTDRTRLRLIANRKNAGNGDSDLQSALIEPHWQLFDEKEDGFNGAILTGLQLSEGDNRPHSARLVLSAELPYGAWQWRHNSIVSYAFGAESVSGVAYQSRWRVSYKNPDLPRLGLEMFNQFGNLRTIHGLDGTQHRAGPILEGRFTEKLGYHLGVSAGLSEAAPDIATKFWLRYSF